MGSVSKRSALSSPASSVSSPPADSALPGTVYSPPASTAYSERCLESDTEADYRPDRHISRDALSWLSALQVSHVGGDVVGPREHGIQGLEGSTTFSSPEKATSPFSMWAGPPDAHGCVPQNQDPGWL